MANLASITVIGRLGGEPETRFTPNEKMVVEFSLAVNKRHGDKPETTTWYRCSAFGRLAETIDHLANDGAMSKGREICVVGNFEPREYRANDGSTKYSFDITADVMQLCGARENAPATSGSAGAGDNAAPYPS